MTDQDFRRISGMIKAVFPRVQYLDNRDTSLLFFNIMNRYEYQDVWQGIKNCLEVERYAPEISTIVQYVEDAEKSRRDALYSMTPQERDLNTVQCPICNDAGFVLVTYKGGTETARPCKCEAARRECPWAFMTDDELESENDKLRKRGQNPPRGKPGHPTEWWIDQFGEPVSVKPGRSANGKRVQR